jgi:hypothetical protein
MLGWIKHRAKRDAPATLPALRQAVTAACNAIPQQVIVSFIAEAKRNIPAG